MSKDWPEGYGYEGQQYFDEPDTLDLLITKWNISSSTISAITGASQIQVWKWIKGIREVPPHYHRKLNQFLDHLEKKQRSG